MGMNTDDAVSYLTLIKHLDPHDSASSHLTPNLGTTPLPSCHLPSDSLLSSVPLRLRDIAIQNFTRLSRTQITQDELVGVSVYLTEDYKT